MEIYWDFTIYGCWAHPPPYPPQKVCETQIVVNTLYTRHEHRQTPTIFYLKIWTFALLFNFLDMEFLGLFGVFVDF